MKDKEQLLKSKHDKFAKVLNPIAFVGVNKEDFKKQFKGKLPFDLNDAWSWIVKNRPKAKK